MAGNMQHGQPLSFLVDSPLLLCVSLVSTRILKVTICPFSDYERMEVGWRTCLASYSHLPAEFPSEFGGGGKVNSPGSGLL